MVSIPPSNKVKNDQFDGAPNSVNATSQRRLAKSSKVIGIIIWCIRLAAVLLLLVLSYRPRAHADILSDAQYQTFAVPQSSEALHIARIQLAAQIASLDKLANNGNSEQQQRAIQQKLALLEAEAARLKKMNDAIDAALQPARLETSRFDPLSPLAATVVLLLAAIILLAWRIKHARRAREKTYYYNDTDINFVIKRNTWPDSDAQQQAPAETMRTFGAMATAEYQPIDFSKTGQCFGKPQSAASRQPAFQQFSVMPKGKFDASFDPHFDDRQNGNEDHEQDLIEAGHGGDTMTIEEVTDLVSEAKFWVSLNRLQNAVMALAPYERIDAPNSPHPWLYLLDLYQKLNQRENYCALRLRFQQRFNAKIPAWATVSDSLDTRRLEDIQHLSKKIRLLWSDKALEPFLESLLFDNRCGKRAGFSLSIYQEILRLRILTKHRATLHQSK